MVEIQPDKKAVQAFQRSLKARARYVSSLAKLPPVMTNGQVNRPAILQRLCLIWVKDPAKVKEKDAISKYIVGGPGAMSAYYKVLNDSPEFKPDGLTLQTRNTAFVTTVGQLIDAISNWYVANKKRTRYGANKKRRKRKK
jgi:hypothetical protein